MTTWKLFALCALPLGIAACGHKEPPPPPAPVLSAAEQACVDRTIASTGATAGNVSIVATGATKTGESIYTTSVGNSDFTCVVDASGAITSFSQGVVH
ncbi:proline racemase [Amaricoccus macauensis]|uniref:Proline racemase n=1 Tax=Amaricoccus macauensis TaxID=57001 RepID=A0A840SIG7_9RHOB|nr:hypothetical protein [Amaricoccus macauensis]MBB5220734.1 proline racemase [Amaricoccus macauensis]